MSKPIIGLNADFRAAAAGRSSFSYIDACYFDAVTQAGGIPLILPPLENDDDLADALAPIDGVVLVGGADLDPRRDGWMMHPTIRPLATRRESFDRRLMRHGRRAAAARVRHRRRHAAPQRDDGRQPDVPHPGRSADRAAASRSARPGPSPHARAHARLAHGAGLRRRRAPRQQHAPHGDRRRGAGLRGDRPLPGRHRRSDRKPHRAIGSPSARSSIPRPTRPRPSTCRIFEEFVDAVKESAAAMRMVA